MRKDKMIIQCEWEGHYHVTGMVEAGSEEEAIEKIKSLDYEYGEDFEPDEITTILRVGNHLIPDNQKEVN